MNIDLPSSSGARSTTPCSLTCSANRLEQVPPELRVGQLAAAEADRDLDPVAVLEELDRAADLRVEVADADLRLEADFLEGHRALLALGLLLALGQLVLVLPEVEETGDRRSGHRCDLDEVEAPLLRHLEGLRRGHDAQLVSLFVDDPDLWDPDHLVDAQVSADGCTPLVAYGSDVAGQRTATPAARARSPRDYSTGLRRSGHRPAAARTAAPAADRQAAIGGLAGQPVGEGVPRLGRLLLAGPRPRRAPSAPRPRGRRGRACTGTFCSWASRILFCIRLSEPSTSTRRPARAEHAGELLARRRCAGRRSG